MDGRSEKKKTLTIVNPNSNERDLTKKNKLGRSLECKVNKKNAIDEGGSTKGDNLKSVSIQSSHEDLAKVLKTLGGISKSLSYKVPKEDSVKSIRGKRKSAKMKVPDPKESNGKQSTPEQNLQSKTSVTDLSPTQSQAFLTQKVAEVLSCVTSKKPFSELNLRKIGTNLSSFKNGNVSVPNFPLLCTKATSFSPHDSNKVLANPTNNKLPIGEKSRSSEYFKYLTLVKQPSKGLSFDNDQSLKSDRQNSKSKGSHSISQNTSETFIRRVDLSKSKESSHFRNSPPSFVNSFESIDWRKLGFSQPDSTQQLRPDTISVYSYSRDSNRNRICTHRSQSGSAKLNLNTGTPSCFSSLLPPMNTTNRFCCCDGKKQKRESFRTESKQLLTEPAENNSKKLSKMSVRVCHCPHLHTENAIKKICFHNCLSPQSLYNSKIFRVNYLLDGEQQKRKQSSESDMKQDEESVMEDFKTANSEVLDSKKSSVKSANKILSPDLVEGDLKKSALSFKALERDKAISKTSLKTIKSLRNSKTEKKEKLKKTRTFSEYSRPNIMLWNKENHIQILGQSNLHKKRETGMKKSFEETRKHTAESKPVKIAPQVKESVRRMVRPSSRLRSRDSKKISNDEKALEELAVLEKLFAKLNTVERSLRKQKLTDSHHQYRSLSKVAVKKDKGEDESRSSFNQMKTLLLLNSPTEEECQQRRKKLRSAIIRHVQNWLKLDFDEL